MLQFHVGNEIIFEEIWDKNQFKKCNIFKNIF